MGRINDAIYNVLTGFVNVFITLTKKATLPKYAHGTGDACCDLCAEEDIIVPAGKVKLVKTGIKVAIPRGFVLLVCSRSGMALKDSVFVINAPGIVDPDYRGDVGVLLCNIGDKDYHVTAGARIAQALLVQSEHMHFNVVSELSETDRGEGGFGSTGVK